MLKTIAAATAAAALMTLAACGDSGGSAEQAGENLDSAIEEATQGEKNLEDGAFEKAGESIDEATGAANDSAADAINDATDGDPKTD